MNLKVIAASSLLAVSALFSAQPANASLVIYCDRGPIPSSSFINAPNRKFIKSLMENFVMTREEAARAARQVCSDMSAVGDLNRLKELTNEATEGYKRR